MSRDPYAFPRGDLMWMRPKWCSYCQKADHDDIECWCTRALPAPSSITESPFGSAPPFARNEVAEAALGVWLGSERVGA